MPVHVCRALRPFLVFPAAAAASLLRVAGIEASEQHISHRCLRFGTALALWLWGPAATANTERPRLMAPNATVKGKEDWASGSTLGRYQLGDIAASLGGTTNADLDALFK